MQLLTDTSRNQHLGLVQLQWGKEDYPLCSGISRFHSVWHLQQHISRWPKKTQKEFSNTGSKRLQKATTTLKICKTVMEKALDNKEQKGGLFDNTMNWAEL